MQQIKFQTKPPNNISPDMPNMIIVTVDVMQQPAAAPVKVFGWGIRFPPLGEVAGLRCQ